jgi:hypothetical protein
LVTLFPPDAGGTPLRPQSGPKVRKGIRLNIPNDTVAVKEGAKVVSSDGKQVGHVEQVLTSPPGDHVTHFLISKGLLVKEKRLIPTVWVNLFTEDEIDLVIKSSTVEKLPVIEPA